MVGFLNGIDGDPPGVPLPSFACGRASGANRNGNMRKINNCLPPPSHSTRDLPRFVSSPAGLGHLDTEIKL